MKHLAVGITQDDGLCLVVVSIDTTKHICSGCTVPTGSCVEHEQVVLWTTVKRLLWDNCDTALSRKKQTKTQAKCVSFNVQSDVHCSLKFV